MSSTKGGKAPIKERIKNMKANNKIENALEVSRTNLLFSYSFADPCASNEELAEWVNSEYGFCKLLENGNFLIKED